LRQEGFLGLFLLFGLGLSGCGFGIPYSFFVIHDLVVQLFDLGLAASGKIVGDLIGCVLGRGLRLPCVFKGDLRVVGKTCCILEGACLYAPLQASYALFWGGCNKFCP